MMITGEQLLDFFAAYNHMIWPMQIVAYILGLIALYLGFRKNILSTRVIAGILAFFWLWVALLFWLPSAMQGFTIGYLFIALFSIEGVLFLIQTVKPKLHFGTYSKGYTITGVIMMLHAMVGYPLLGLLIGHSYPRTPSFGLTPCPLIVFTFGMLLLTGQEVSKILLVIPFFYSLSGILWVSIGIYEDIGLVLSGLICVLLIWNRDIKLKKAPQEEATSTYESKWSLDLTETPQKK